MAASSKTDSRAEHRHRSASMTRGLCPVGWPALMLLAGLLPGCVAHAADWAYGGHVKGQFAAAHYPDDSLFREQFGASSRDYSLDARFKLRLDAGAWEAAGDVQLIVRYGELLELSRLAQGLETVPDSAPSDERRLFDLTWVMLDEEDALALQRLDRLYAGYRGDEWVVRFGRQVVSWGNGLVYTPMDFFNPFDPAAIDKEYKTGDDMLYGQYLRANGDDVQAVLVGRRDPASGEASADVATLAFKYHGFFRGFEYDALAAHHYGEPIVGMGGNHAVGGAIWRGDAMLSRGEEQGAALLLVSSLSYSWVMGGKNVSGLLEYFHNGFGIAGGDYGPLVLAAHPDLTDRIARGELFTLGRDYLAASALIELTPLVLCTPNLFVNLDDPSALLQLVGQFDLLQDLQLLAALSLPLGPAGSEFGGIRWTAADADPLAPDSYLSTGPGVWAQIAWYF